MNSKILLIIIQSVFTLIDLVDRVIQTQHRNDADALEEYIETREKVRADLLDAVRETTGDRSAPPAPPEPEKSGTFKVDSENRAYYDTGDISDETSPAESEG